MSDPDRLTPNGYHKSQGSSNQPFSSYSSASVFSILLCYFFHFLIGLVFCVFGKKIIRFFCFCIFYVMLFFFISFKVWFSVFFVKKSSDFSASVFSMSCYFFHFLTGLVFCNFFLIFFCFCIFHVMLFFLFP